MYVECKQVVITWACSTPVRWSSVVH